VVTSMRAGVIGAGFISVRSHVPGYRSVPGVEVVAICDVNEQRAQQTAKDLQIPHYYTDYREMLKESLDLVSVCSPNALHAQMTIDALQSGAHVLCEKPMALTFADALAMIGTSQRMNKSLTVGFHNRYRPDMMAMHETIQSGKLGEIYHAKASLLRRSGIPGYGSWFTNKDLAGGGAMMDIGCHILDLALWLLGHPKPVSVAGATYAKFGPLGKGLGTWGSDHYPKGARCDVDDLATAFVRFEGGLTLAVEASWALHGTDGQRIQVFGTTGGVEFNDKLFGKEAPVRYFGEDNDALTEAPVALPEVTGNAYVREINDWISRIRAGQSPMITAEQAARVVQIVEGLYQSAERGQEIRLA
jgi:predicted dehydrogenase